MNDRFPADDFHFVSDLVRQEFAQIATGDTNFYAEFAKCFEIFRINRGEIQFEDPLAFLSLINNLLPDPKRWDPISAKL